MCFYAFIQSDLEKRINIIKRVVPLGIEPISETAVLTATHMEPTRVLGL